MRVFCLFLLLAAANVGLAQNPEKVAKEAAPHPAASDKAIVLEITIPASRAAVWQAFTTSEGLSTWLTPEAVVDLRKGGEWTAHFPGGSTGGGTILSFVPQEEIVLSALAPDRFPTVRAERTTARFHFEAKGDSTIVQLVQTGWKSGEEWDKAYEYLLVGNAQLLSTLHRRFVNGPIDWVKEWGVSPKK
ncbi:MAG TPA: SRPBCC domain-containing protein [Terriglobales bacterium]|nr:SRPBCC domain-containing protein [Terriglobales bacterium]